MAQALGHEACRSGFDVVLRVGGPHTRPSAWRSRRRHVRATAAHLHAADVLILDDFGLKPLPVQGPEDFYEVINERCERGALIITSNRAFTEWPDLFQSPLLASVAPDRLAHDAQQIVITGDSFRAKGRRCDGRRE